MRENKVIYGLIGYGGMGRWHTEILSNVPEIEIGGIYDIKEEKKKVFLCMARKRKCYQTRILMSC